MALTRLGRLAPGPTPAEVVALVDAAVAGWWALRGVGAYAAADAVLGALTALGVRVGVWREGPGWRPYWVRVG